MEKKLLALLLALCLIVSLFPFLSSNTYATASNDYTQWRQGDAEWNYYQAWPSSQYPNATAHYMSEAGCLVVSVAMLLRHYNVVTETDVNQFNPWICNEALKAAGAFNSAADMYWEGPQKAYSGFKYVGSASYSDSKLIELFGQGYACIVKVNGSGGYEHYVAVRSATNSGITIMDPGWGYTSLSSFSTKYEIRYWQPTPSGITISFNANGGNCSTSSKTITPGSAIGSLPTPTRAGYDFAGWYPSVNGNADPYTASSTFSSNTTLYAHWANQLYQGNHISFELNGGAIYGNTSSYPITDFNVWRDQDYLVIFNCGGQLIDSNSWGSEAQISSDGEVLAIRGYGESNQFTVPSDGFVVSGHDAGRAIIDNMHVHDYVAYNKATKRAYLYSTQGAYLKDNTYVQADSYYGSLPKAQKDSYYFKGWYLSEGDIYAVNYLTYYNRARLYAKWDSSPVPFSTVEYNNHRYELYDYHMTWAEAEAFCEAHGGHLVTITDAVEQAKVLELAKTGSFCTYYIGCSDSETEGVWKWITGEPFSYQNWDAGTEPSNGTGENYAHILTVNYGPNKQVGEWNDTENDKVYGFYGYQNGGFICEYDVVCDHKYNYEVTTPPTKAEEGVLTGTCSKCSGTVTVTLPVLNTTDYDKTVIAGNCVTRPIEHYTWKTTAYGDYYFDVVMGDDYSEWSTDYPTGIDESLIESRTEYRYSDYETTTSYDTYMSGWELKSSEWQQSGSGTINYVASWPSGFNTSHSLYSQYNNTPKSASETATDKTVINSTGTAGWIYYHWCRGTYTGGPINRATSPYYTSEFNSFHAFFSTTNPNTLTPSSDGDGSYIIPNGDCCTDSYWYYPVTVSSQSYTTYKKLFTYERWTDWSAWGTTPYTASNTRQVETRTVYRYITTPIGEHTWDDGKITTPATCTEDGVKTYTCSVCHETKAEVIEKLEHDYQAVVTAPTCTEQGYTTHTCSRCGASYVDATAEATGHNIVNGVCTVCGLQVPTVTIASVSGAPGDTVSVPITISNNGGFAGFTFTFTADDALSITKIAKGELLQSADSGSFTTNVSGGVVTWFDSVNTAGDGTLMVLTVKINDNAQEGQYQIQAALKDNNETNFVDENSQAIPISFAQGTITVEPIPLEIKLTISGDPVTTAPGSTIAVPVMISGGANFAGFTLTVDASDGLTLTKIEKGTLLKNADGMFTPNVSQSIVNWTSTGNIPGEGELLILSFTINESVADGSNLTVSLGLKDNKTSNFSDENENPVGVRFQSIPITVQSVISGDVNSNGEVDTIDSIRLVRFLVDLVDLTPAQRKAADVNHDNDITTTDAIRLAKYLVGLVDTLNRQPSKGPRLAAGKAEISVGSAVCKNGDTVTVPVTIADNPGFAGFTFTITGAEGLTLKEITKGSLLQGADGMFTKNVAQNRINWTSSDNVTGDGELMTLTFEVSETAANGDYAVTVELKDRKPTNFANADETPVSVNFTPGTVSVQNEAPPTAIITVGNATAQSGDTVTLPVSISENPGFAGFTFTITGAEGLTLKDITKGSLLQSADGMFTKNVAQNRINWTSSDNVTGDGELMVLTFEVSETAANENYAVAVELKDGKPTNFANADETPVAVSFTPGTVSVQNEAPPTTIITVGNATAQSGDTVTLPVSISENPGFAGFTFTITGAEGLTLKDITKGSLLQSADGMFTKNVAQNRINWTSSDNVTGDGELMVLTFEVSETAANEDYAVAVELKAGKPTNFATADETSIPVAFVAGGITVLNHVHHYTDVVTPPTCTEQGYTTHTCECGDSYVDTFVPALDHDLVDHEAKAPTCTEIGWNAYQTCTRCDFTTYSELAALGHDLVDHEGKAPTCTEIGWNAYQTCTRCDYTTCSELAALGHDLVDHDAKAPTCTEIGWNAYDTCSRCDYTTYEELTAFGHNWNTPTYTWSENNDEITAIRTCGNDESHVEAENGMVTSEVTLEATVDAEGEITYTATFTNPAFSTQTKVIKTPKLQGPNDGLPCDGGDSCPGKVFTDMPAKGNWAHDAIDWAIVNNVTSGTSKTTFSPGKGCTRAQVVTFLWRAAGQPSATSNNNPFADVKSDTFYYDAVLWAVEQGITSGTSKTAFSPNSTCTRGQIVTFLWRFAGQPNASTTNNPFADVKAGAYFEKAVLWAAETGVTAGTSATTFSPEKTCTRAQVVTFLYRNVQSNH